MLKPQIYVACLAAYNNGYLHSKWIDATQSVSCIYEEIKAMLTESPISGADEIAIHGCEGFGNCEIYEYDSVERIAEIAAFISEHGELGAELLGRYSIEEAEKVLKDDYHGAYDDEVDFAEYIFNECYEAQVPDHLLGYFDFACFARDLFINNYFSVKVDGQTHVFSCS